MNVFKQFMISKSDISAGLITELLLPETSLEKEIIRQPEWIEGARWGKPRWGHPEGAILYHIKEVLDNIDRLPVSKKTRHDLRLVALLHDNFKHLEDKKRPRDWSKHHAMIARKFALNFLQTDRVLDVVELHDEAFYAWRMAYVYHSPSEGYARLRKLLTRLTDHLQFYYLFFKCDTLTGDKITDPLLWFEKTVEGLEPIEL